MEEETKTIELKDSLFEEFCNLRCPNIDERIYWNRYGQDCPNCYVSSYHDWLMSK